ncbi:MAG: hypothetical protein U0271_33585 [Polyangiaceae bacterium]
MAVTSALTQASPAPAPALGGWVLSARFDLFFFVGSSLSVVLAWLASEVLAMPALYVIGAVAVLSNGPHLASTWTRVYLDARERRERPIHYFVAPLIVVGAVAALLFIDGASSALIRSVLFYWAFWHFVAQCWGLLRIYQRKAGDVGKPVAHLERAVLWAVALAPFIERLHSGPWALFGSEIYHPDVPRSLVLATWGLAGLLSFAYMIVHIVRVARHELAPGLTGWIRPLFLGATALAFYVPFTRIKSNGATAFAAAACWHGLQYIGIVWFYNRNRYKSGLDARARLVSWVSQPGREIWYFVTLLAVVGVFYAGIVVAGQFVLEPARIGSFVWLSLTFTHYYLDGVIWKLRRPELAKNLGAAPA